MADGRGDLSGQNPANSLVGGGGPAGEKQEELKGYLWGCSARHDMGGFELAEERGGRRWSDLRRQCPGGKRSGAA